VAISQRITRCGYKCIWVNDAELRHHGAKSAGGYANPLEYYYSQRNAVLLARESSIAGKLITHCWVSPRALGRIAKCVLCRRPAAARATLAGLLDGYLGGGGKWKRHDSSVRQKTSEPGRRCGGQESTLSGKEGGGAVSA
jgi:hypothetical protein